MRLLNAYVEQLNAFREFAKRPLLNLENPSDRQSIGRCISSGLEPENLSFDGELSRAETQRRYTYMCKLGEQLIALDPSIQIEGIS